MWVRVSEREKKNEWERDYERHEKRESDKKKQKELDLERKRRKKIDKDKKKVNENIQNET